MKTPTPLEQAPAALVEFAGTSDLRLKREDLNELRMFKWRAALPVVESLARGGAKQVVTSSTGNHGIATAWACCRAGVEAIVYVPPGATPAKLKLLEELGAELRVSGTDLDEAKAHARAWATERGLPFFEDGAEPLQFDAYGAIGREIALQCPDAKAVVIPIGNGALAGGVGAALREAAPHALRIGVVAKNMPVMAASYEAGEALELADGSTIADGLAVRVAIPLAVERLATGVERIVRVSEHELAEALVACHDAGVEVEPSAAAALAALHADADLARLDGAVVLVMTGANVDPTILERARREPGSFPD